MSQIIFTFLKSVVPSLSPVIALAIICYFEQMLMGTSSDDKVPADETQEEKKPVAKKTSFASKVLVGGATLVVVPSVLLFSSGFLFRGFFIPQNQEVILDGVMFSAPAGTQVEKSASKTIIIFPK